MYLHIGSDCMLNSEEIIGVFDIEQCSVSKRARDFLYDNQRQDKIVNAAEDLPKSFIVTEGKLYISGLSPNVLKQRIKNYQHQ